VEIDLESADQFARPRRDCPNVVAVVDDDQSVRESVAGLIESVGYCVTFFCSAEEFLDSAEINTVGCMIVDVRLPGISGLELFSRMRVHQQSIPTVFITGHVDGSVRTQAIEAGGIAFLYKPFQADVLLYHVHAALVRPCSPADEKDPPEL
jgi:FixJ family two-component response regulator